MRKGTCRRAAVRFDRYDRAKRAAEKLWTQRRFRFSGATRLAPDGDGVVLAVESEHPLRIALLERLGGAVAVLDGPDAGRATDDGGADGAGDTAAGRRVARPRRRGRTE